MINNIAEVGFDYICPLTFACNFAVIGVALGVFLGLMRVVTSAFVFGSVITFPAFVNGDMMNFVNAVIGLGISTVVGAVLGYVFCEQDTELS